MNVCDFAMPQEGIRATSNNLFLICAPFTILFNMLVLVIALKYVKLADRFDQWFVIGMSFSNLMYGLVFLVVSPYADTLPRWICKPYYALVWTCTATSVLFLLLLNLHKFVALFMPFHSLLWLSKRSTIAQITFVLVTVVGYSIVSSLKLTYIELNPCYQCRVKPHPYLHVGMLVGFYAVPLCLSLIISICIFALAQKMTRMPTGERIVDDTKHKTFKRVFFVFSYTVFTAITVLPFRISYCIDSLCRIRNTEDERRIIATKKLVQSIWQPWIFVAEFHTYAPCINYMWYTSVFLCLLPFGFLLNPIITIGTQRTYRSGLKKLAFKLSNNFEKLKSLRNNFSRTTSTDV